MLPCSVVIIVCVVVSFSVHCEGACSEMARQPLIENAMLCAGSMHAFNTNKPHHNNLSPRRFCGVITMRHVAYELIMNTLTRPIQNRSIHGKVQDI